MKLSPKHEKAAILLAQGNTGVATAEAVEVSPQTISEWKRIPEFQALINKLRLDALESARTALQASATTAAKTLQNLAESAKDEETRRKAALDILRITGLEPGNEASFGWGLGPTDPNEIAASHGFKSSAEILEMVDQLKKQWS